MDPRTVVEHATQALIDRDIERHLQFVADEVTLLATPTEVSLGKDAYREFAAALLALPSGTGLTAFEILDTTGGDGETTWVRSRWQLVSPDYAEPRFGEVLVAVHEGKISAMHPLQGENEVGLTQERGLSAAGPTTGARPSDWRRCAICGVALPGNVSHRLCDHHLAECERRLTGGVSAAELSHRWRDSLATWRDRPASLTGEPLAARLGFHRRREGWLLFMAGYPRRLPDWLAVREDTGEARRFVEIGPDEVEGDLSGVRPAPEWARDLARWGQPESRELTKRFDLAWQLVEPPTWMDQVIRGNLRVYGLGGEPFGLRYRSAQMSGGRDGYERVSLDFAGEETGRIVALTLTSNDVMHGGNIVLSPPQDRPFDRTRDTLQARLRGDAAWEPAITDRSSRTLALDNRLFQGEILHPEPVRGRISFIFRCPDVILTGRSTGLSDEQLLYLLHELVPLNDHPEILARYDAEARERLQREHPYEPPTIIIPNLSGPPPTAFDQVRAATAALQSRYPEGWVPMLVAHRGHITPEGHPHVWSVDVWGGPTAPETAGFLVNHGALVTDRPTTIMRFGGSGGFTRPPTLFSLASGPDVRLLDSNAAVQRLEELGGTEFRQRTGARLERLCLGAERDGAALWGARYEQQNDRQHLILILDARTGVLVFSGSQPA